MRDDRVRFLIFGFLPALNVVALFVASIFVATSGRSGSGAALAVVLLSILVSLAAVVHAGVRRARDLGWSGTTTVVVIGLCIVVMPLVPVLLLWLLLAPGQPATEVPQPTSLNRWLAWVLVLGAPWMLTLVARSLG
ncbi:MAG: DUF805 domain-containing protein [Hydrogenophaga sp.]|uniref:DUF805 domain-containing protein n=1 Tax=Hydrogenophaga sp. TaxID=1904254 RepID=UPI001E1602B5|nr:DUF805 domain-containing protein [Hydrogenophaga sp.]MBX3609725.1 DUF805 domain-containing protein [Hydrogenophaga sp.]